MLEIKDKFAVLLVSCDKYSDLWKPFFQLFWRFWPDCPFSVYLLSNNVGFEIPQVKTLLVGNDLSWSDSLSSGVTQLEEEYIFIFFEDLFLFDFVNTAKLLKLFSWILESKANYVRMNSSPKPDKRYNELVGIVSKGTIYRTATVLSVWKKDILLDLLKVGESAWDFEVYGTIRADSYEGFFSSYEKYFSFMNGVIKGKWQRSSIRKLTSLGIEIDLTRRETMTLSETIKIFIAEQRANFLQLLPTKYRRKVKDFILGGKYNYKIKG